MLDYLVLIRTNIGDIIGFISTDRLSKLLEVTIAVLMIYGFTKFKNNIVNLIITFFIFGIFLISGYISHSLSIVFSFAIILYSTNVCFDNIVRYSLKLITIVTVIIMTLGYLGLITNVMKNRSIFDSTRYSYGFGHPNTLALLSFQWIAEYLYHRRNRHSFKKYVAPIFVFFVIMRATYSFTFFASSFLLIFFCVLVELIEWKSKLSKRLLKITLFFSMSIILFLVRFYWINPYRLTRNLRTLRARFILSQNYIHAYGINIFGHKISIGSRVSIPGYRVGYFYLDNGYIRILIESGLLVFCLFIVAYYIYFRKIIQKQNTIICVITIFYLIYGFMEYKAFSVAFNIFLLHLGHELFYNLSKGSKLDTYHI